MRVGSRALSRRRERNCDAAGYPDAKAAPTRIVPTIERLSSVDDRGALKTGDPSAELNGWLAVVLKGDTSGIDPAKAVLFLDGRAIPGLTDTLYLSNQRALVFHLARNSDNADAWKPLLGSPGTLTRSVAVGLWLEKPAADAFQTPIAGDGGVQPSFNFFLISGYWLAAGVVALVMVIVAVLLRAGRGRLFRATLSIRSHIEYRDADKAVRAWQSLTNRDRVAPDLIGPLSLPGPTNDGPLRVECTDPRVSQDVVRASCHAPPNSHQDALARMAKLLPSRPLNAGAAMPVAHALSATGFESAIATGLDAASRIKSFLGGLKLKPTGRWFTHGLRL